jgi:hypothetical protein
MSLARTIRPKSPSLLAVCTLLLAATATDVRAQQLPPVEHLVRVHVVPSGNSRHRGFRQERLFHHLSSLLDCSAPLLYSRHPDL